jgi:hypothetical protein
MEIVYKYVKNSLFEFKPEVVIEGDTMIIKESYLIKGIDKIITPQYETKIRTLWFNPWHKPYIYTKAPNGSGSFMIIKPTDDVLIVTHHILKKGAVYKNIFEKTYKWIKSKF